MAAARLGSVLAILLFLETRHAFAIGQRLPDFRRLEVAMGPEDEEMIEQIGGFHGELALLAAYPLDDGFHRLLAQLLGDFLRALGEQPGRIGTGRICPLAAFDHLVEAVENAGIQWPSRILRQWPYPLDFDDSSVTHTTH